MKNALFAGLMVVLSATQVFAAYGDAMMVKKEIQMDIIDTAVGAGSFKTLAAALQAGGLIETLKSAGPFTVFAPTDEAFAKLPAGTVENLLKPENKDKLVAILTYHVVAGNGVKINNAAVTKADIITSNGVIHVIDTVLLP